MKIHHGVLIGLLVLAAGCAFQKYSTKLPDPSPISPQPGIEFSPVPDPMQPAAIQQITTPTPNVDPACVPAQSNLALKPGLYTNDPNLILDFLNSGGIQKELDQALYNAGVANQPVSVVESDLTGDGKTDFVVSIFDPQSQTIPPGGTLLIFICKDKQYELSYQEPSMPSAGAPGIRYVQDLNADGRAEAVTSSGTCEAHICFENMKILAWSGSTFENRMVGNSADLPYPVLDIQNSEVDHIFDIKITSSGAGSAGAGPLRNITRRWSYQADQGLWTAGPDIPGESNYRIHILHDAVEAERKGDYPTALLLLQRVVSDVSLEDWVSPEEERANLSAFARYKMMVIYFIQGQESFAQSLFAEMMNNYPVGSPQESFVEMALVFKAAYTDGGLSAGCSAAQKYAQEHTAQILDVLGPQVFGDGNPGYTDEDVCP